MYLSYLLNWVTYGTATKSDERFFADFADEDVKVPPST